MDALWISGPIALDDIPPANKVFPAMLPSPGQITILRSGSKAPSEPAALGSARQPNILGFRPAAPSVILNSRKTGRGQAWTAKVTAPAAASAPAVPMAVLAS